MHFAVGGGAFGLADARRPLDPASAAGAVVVIDQQGKRKHIRSGSGAIDGTPRHTHLIDDFIALLDSSRRNPVRSRLSLAFAEAPKVGSSVHIVDPIFRPVRSIPAKRKLDAVPPPHGTACHRGMHIIRHLGRPIKIVIVIGHIDAGGHILRTCPAAHLNLGAVSGKPQLRIGLPICQRAVHGNSSSLRLQRQGMVMAAEGGAEVLPCRIDRRLRWRGYLRCGLWQRLQFLPQHCSRESPCRQCEYEQPYRRRRAPPLPRSPYAAESALSKPVGLVVHSFAPFVIRAAGKCLRRSL
ncbi:hypothetical protein D3C81_1326530 [compost metagenome]